MSLKSRLEAIEQAHGGGECPRCSGTTVAYVNDKLEGASRHGRKLPPAEAEAFVEEEEDGRCPVCGTKRAPTIRIGSPAP